MTCYSSIWPAMRRGSSAWHRRARSIDDREVTYGFGELDEPVPAYATTLHESQGSEYPAVVIPLRIQHYPMVQRNLGYTGVTRGKRLGVLVGSGRHWRSPSRERRHGGDGRSCGSGSPPRSG